MTTVHVSSAVAAVNDLYAGLIGEPTEQLSTTEQLTLLAERLADGHRRGHPGATVELANWHPRLVGQPAEAIAAAALTEADYLHTVARDHGYPDWSAALAAPGRPDPRFERCVDALLAGDTEQVSALLAAHPDLATARSHWGHRATLLHYLAANGVEIHRQRVPADAADLARLLLAHDADPAATANPYGTAQTVLDLLLTSSHPAHAGVTKELAQVLRG